MRRPALFMLLAAALVLCLTSAAAAADDLFDTKTAAIHMQKGIELLRAKKYDAAIQQFEEASASAPTAESYYYLGYAYYMKGKTGDGESRKRSKEHFDKAYELDPSYAPGRPPLTEQPKAAAQPEPAATPVLPAKSSEKESEERPSRVFIGSEQPTPPAPPGAPVPPPAEQPREQPQQQPPQQEQQPPQPPETPKTN